MEDASLPSTNDDGSELIALENFVIENDDLLALESQIGRFNIFDALGIARTEIRHSNFLAFLLDPAESHGFGQTFLKVVLMDLLKAAPPQLRPFSPIELDGTDLRGVEVRREWGHIDLLISASEPSFVVAIENKVDALESEGQLETYERMTSTHFFGVPKLFVFLTRNGNEASRTNWITYTYADLWRVLKRARHAYAPSFGTEATVFLDHYLNLIGTRFMDDPKIDELCQRIWKNHRQALQLIYDRIGSPSATVAGLVEASVKNDPRFHCFYRSGGLVDFVPVDWLSWMPPIGIDFKSAPQAWFVLRLEVYNPKPQKFRLDFYAQICQMNDRKLRERIVQAILPNWQMFGFVQPKSKGEASKYTRVCGRQTLINWSEESPPDESKIQSIVASKLNELIPHLQLLASKLRENVQPIS